ncbi:MAG: hypothetical protein M0Z61_07765 [Nitrospiraceae bacterium]|nr:hypothetical protein [Nitrospiraceae bacterium]
MTLEEAGVPEELPPPQPNNVIETENKKIQKINEEMLFFFEFTFIPSH